MIERLDDTPATAVRPQIFAAIEAFNDQATGLTAPMRPLALVVRDPSTQAVTGGLYAVSYYGWLFVELLVIPQHLRGAGLGTRLLRQAGAVAREHVCLGVWLDTFSFQARGFYEKLGYVTFGEMPDYPPGYARFWLKKRFGDAAPP